MSYSFNCSGATKPELMSAVDAEFEKVIAQQPIHADDREVHEQTVRAMVDLLREPGEGEVYLVNVAGSCWRDDGKSGFNGGSINVSTNFRPK